MRWFEEWVKPYMVEKKYTIVNLFGAIEKKNTDRLVECLARGVDLSSRLSWHGWEATTALSYTLDLENYYYATLLLEAGADPFVVEEMSYQVGEKIYRSTETPMCQVLSPICCDPMPVICFLYYDVNNLIQQEVHGENLYAIYIQPSPKIKTIIDAVIKQYGYLRNEQRYGDECLKKAREALKESDVMIADAYYLKSAGAFLNAAKVMIVEIPKIIKQMDETLMKGREQIFRDRYRKTKRQLKYWHHHITMTLLEKAKKTFDCVEEQSWNDLELTDKSIYNEKRAQQREAQEWYDAYQVVRDDPQYQLYASYVARIKMRFSENNTISSSNSVTLFQQEENIIELSDQARNVHPSAGGLRRRVFN